MKTKSIERPIEELFENTCDEFQATVARIAKVANKTALEVYAIWRKYSAECAAWDQSALLAEFVTWHRADLGGNIEGLMAALWVPGQSA
jgi:hypothetical protein